VISYEAEFKGGRLFWQRKLQEGIVIAGSNELRRFTLRIQSKKQSGKIRK
jgi:hypothetical protein